MNINPLYDFKKEVWNYVWHFDLKQHLKKKDTYPWAVIHNKNTDLENRNWL